MPLFQEAVPFLVPIATFVFHRNRENGVSSWHLSKGCRNWGSAADSFEGMGNITIHVQRAMKHQETPE